MDTASLSDTFFTIFLLCAIASALLFTKGAMLNRIGFFNVLKRFSSPEASNYDDFTRFTGRARPDQQNRVEKDEKDNVLEFTLILTVGFFMLFILCEFIIN